MNKSNFIQTLGYPLKSERLQELQTAYSIFNSLGALAGNLTIISGCELEGTTIKNGCVYIDGEIIEFREADGAGTPNVIIIEEAVKRGFKNGIIKEVHTIRYATFGTAATSWAWSNFQRPMPTKFIQANFKAHLSIIDDIVNRLNEAEVKLETIAVGAEVNVASNWNITDVLSDAYIHNKPAGDILYRGSVTIGDTAASRGKVSDPFVINFPNLGTSEYIVLGSLKSGSGWDNDSGVFWTTDNYLHSSFTLITREIDSRVQSHIFNFVLIKK